MVISILIFLIILVYYVINVYLKEYIEVTKIYKTLRKLLGHRDMLLLKILPDIKNKKQKEKIINLINNRNKMYSISYDDAIISDVKLHNELKNVYIEIEKMQKNEIQSEIFKKLMIMEKQIKGARNKYSSAVEKYNLSLTIHPKVFIKILHMRPLDTYKKDENLKIN